MRRCGREGKDVPSCLLYSFAIHSIENSTSSSAISWRSSSSSRNSRDTGPRECPYFLNT